MERPLITGINHLNLQTTDMERAIAAARRAFDEGPWSKFCPPGGG